MKTRNARFQWVTVAKLKLRKYPSNSTNPQPQSKNTYQKYTQKDRKKEEEEEDEEEEEKEDKEKRQSRETYGEGRAKQREEMEASCTRRVEMR